MSSASVLVIDRAWKDEGRDFELKRRKTGASGPNLTAMPSHDAAGGKKGYGPTVRAGVARREGEKNSCD